MSQSDDLLPGEDLNEDSRIGLREWMATPANVTRGWLLASVALSFVFLGCAIFAAVHTIRLDNRVTRDNVTNAVIQASLTCTEINDRRSEAKVIAEESVAADRAASDSDLNAIRSERAIWRSIETLLTNGIPEPVRATIFDGLDDREADIRAQQEAIELRETRVATAYAPADCSVPPTTTATTNEGIDP